MCFIAIIVEVYKIFVYINTYDPCHVHSVKSMALSPMTDPSRNATLKSWSLVSMKKMPLIPKSECSSIERIHVAKIWLLNEVERNDADIMHHVPVYQMQRVQCSAVGEVRLSRGPGYEYVI